MQDRLAAYDERSPGNRYLLYVQSRMRLISLVPRRMDHDENAAGERTARLCEMANVVGNCLGDCLRATDNAQVVQSCKRAISVKRELG
jgi:hypothetical protein